MIRVTSQCLMILLAGMAVAGWMNAAQAQDAKPKPNEDATKKAAEPEFVLRVYDVSDLVQSVPDYPYRGGLPTTDESGAANHPGLMGGFGGAVGSGGLGGGGMGMGGMGGMGGGGGGFFQVPDAPAANSSPADMPRPEALHQFGEVGGFGLGGMGFDATANGGFTIVELEGVISSMVAPDTWTIEFEGETYHAEIEILGHTLIVRQTPEVHEEIAEFLEDLREQTGTRRQVTVEVYWVTLDHEGAKKLAGELIAARKDPEKAAALLATLNLETADYAGRITCQSGQTVHIVSGQRRTVITGATPVVGSGSVAYQPQIAFPNIGALLQVRPSLEPDGERAVLDLRSTLTAWADGGEPVRLLSGSGPAQTSDGKPAPATRAEAVIDRVLIPAQHLATTIRVPLGIPTIVGSMSPVVDPDGAARAFGKTEKAENGKKTQTYLIVTVTTESEMNATGGGFF